MASLRSRVLLGGAATLTALGVLALAAVVPPERGGAFGTTRAVITGITASSGPLSGGGVIELSGHGLETVTKVTVGSMPASALSLTVTGSLQVVAPPSATFDARVVEVTAHAGTDSVTTTVELEYTYVADTPVDRQMNYLFDHWDSYNTAQFGDLNVIGGDCMNFVSQSLLARGWQMTEEWYSRDGGQSWGDPWGHVPSFDEWLRGHPEYGAQIVPLDDREEIALGDLVVFDWEGDGSLDHIQVVSSIAERDGEISIEMVGHNLDSDYRDLDVVLTVDHPGATGHFWRIP